MNITIIAPFTFGYIDALAEKLAERPDAKVTFIRTDTFTYTYASLAHRIYSALLKVFLSRNLKKEFVADQIRSRLDCTKKQDFILIIRADKLDEKILPYLKTRTHKLITYYFDGISNFPKKARLIHYFDEVYSYEKDDVEKYGLQFITNFIPNDEILTSDKNEGVFNIASYDNRFSVLKKIARQLKKYDYPYLFIVRTKKERKSDLIKLRTDYLPFSETKKFITKAAILLDIQKDKQRGLTFRVFESLQSDKKLITTNEDIKNYDFYNPHNFLIIDKENPHIPIDFLNTPFVPLPDVIKVKYTRDAWLNTVFKLVDDPVAHNNKET